MAGVLVLAVNVSSVNLAASIAIRPPGREDTTVFDVYFTQGEILLGTESKVPSPAVLEALANVCAFGAPAEDEATQQHSAEVLLQFLIQTARSSVHEYRPYGTQAWDSLHTSIKLVMSVPSGWGKVPRALVRSAAVRVLGVWADPSSIIIMKEAEASALHVKFSLIALLDSSIPRGALRHYFDRPGTVVAACHYGTDNEELVLEENRENLPLGRSLLNRMDQNEYLINLWDNILPKGTVLQSGEEKAKQYTEMIAKSDSPIYTARLYAYSGPRDVPPKFIFKEDDTTLNPGFELACEFQADFTALLAASRRIGNGRGSSYRKITFEILLTLDTDRVTARMKWRENGVDKYSPATLAYF
ncbi:hypothetical protein FIBSPDRAFT_930690 [Athelia psychrophila]|uniref:Uncharacterized protein n=1 Tax=Athelia psychrophila TaxID=1759441 RepID=A0A166LMF3_9AGAM|nr:hypothetical protein FIBSPDRAFT_930690 [Fibularhizoctonia sp. CBS 109695]